MPPLASRRAFRQEGTTPENLAATGEQRLRSLAAAILGSGVRRIRLIRATVAEARRFPDLAISVHQTARDRRLESIAQLLGEFANSDALGASPAFAPDRGASTARRFREQVLLPMTNLYNQRRAGSQTPTTSSTAPAARAQSRKGREGTPRQSIGARFGFDRCAPPAKMTESLNLAKVPT
jgi:hypothetical protein